MALVSELVAQRAVDALGDVGRAWVDALPAVVEGLARRWEVELGAPETGGSSSYVVQATTSAGEAAVLKVALPLPWVDAAAEGAVLAAAAGRGYVPLLARDPELGAVLIARLGERLDSCGAPAEEQLRVTARVLRDAWRVPADGFRDGGRAGTLAREVVRTWERLGRPCPGSVVAAAVEAATRRGVDASADVIVAHGDPHAGNLLSTGEGWALIDPVGFLAPREHDLGVAVRDRSSELLASPDPAALLRSWCRLLADEADADADAVWEWALADRVSTALYLRACGGPQHGADMLAVAQLLV